MKVQLFRPPFDNWYSHDRQLETLQSPPTNLAILDAALRKGGFQDTEIIDGFGKTLDYCIGKIDGDIVGVTDIYAVHLNALEILRKAKEKNAITVIGGQNVRPIAKRILRNHDYVDYAVVGDGEIALPLIVGGAHPESIPNLVYRKNGEPVSNREISVPLDLLFDFDKVVDFKPDPEKAVIISSIRGCVKAENYRRCDWCIMRDKLRTMEVNLVWQQIRLLREKYGYKFMIESGDSFYVGDFPDRLLSARPEELRDTKFRAYLNPEHVTKGAINTLSSLNVHWPYLGVDEIDETKLRALGRANSNEEIHNAVELLSGIIPQPTIQISILVGLPGETRENLEKKVEFARRVSGMFNDFMVFASLPVPWPGTMLFEKIRNHPKARAEYPGDMDNDDFFHYDELVRVQLKYFTSVSWKQALDAISRIKKLAPAGQSSSYFVQDQFKRE